MSSSCPYWVQCSALFRSSYQFFFTLVLMQRPFSGLMSRVKAESESVAFEDFAEVCGCKTTTILN